MLQIDSESASARIYEPVKARILDGDLKPGAVLSENLLAQEYGTSRTPAREALRRLANDGLVDIVPKRGTFVASLPSASAVRQLYETREAIAGMAARLAARAATDTEIVALRDLMARMGKAKSADVQGELADEFITTIDRLCRNERLASIDRGLLDQTHRLRQAVMQHDLDYFQAALGFRRELVEAIAEHDEDAAERHARALVAYVKHEVLTMLVEV